LIKRTSLNIVNNLIQKNLQWKVLDIGCGFTANKNATVIADIQDLSNFYSKKTFIKITDKKLPFKDNEFDFVIASHVIEHVEDFQFFIKELERVAKKGYIELPTRLGDNLIFENKSDHIWWFVFNDQTSKLVASKRNQLVEPFMSVATGKMIDSYFRESMVLELYWEEKINYVIDEKIQNLNMKKLFFLTIIKKYFSKKLRAFLKKTN
jgi:ubiquinone/menaquinone biosynthesis C-methylase UbiE